MTCSPNGYALNFGEYILDMKLKFQLLVHGLNGWDNIWAVPGFQNTTKMASECKEDPLKLKLAEQTIWATVVPENIRTPGFRFNFLKVWPVEPYWGFHDSI